MFFVRSTSLISLCFANTANDQFRLVSYKNMCSRYINHSETERWREIESESSCTTFHPLLLTLCHSFSEQQQKVK